MSTSPLQEARAGTLGYPQSWSRMNGSNGHQQYEGELPPEVFAEFSGGTKVAREPRYILQEAPPSPPTYRPPIAIPPQPAKSSVLPWVLVAIIGTGLLAMVSKQKPSEASWSAQPTQPQVMRAQPAATPNGPGHRYEYLAPAYDPNHVVGDRRMTTMPDGSQLVTTFRGYLGNVDELPLHGGQLGDMWGVGNNFWVLTRVPNSYRIGWVDPPGNGTEVDNVEVRRAEMVVPRAEFVK